MSSITYFNRRNERYSSGPYSLSTISVEDEYGNQAFNSSIADDFYAQFLHSKFESSIPSGLIPPGLRALYPGIVVFERPPSMQMVQYLPMNMDGIAEYEQEEDEYPDWDNYYIPVPWQIYIASYSNSPTGPVINGVKMFFANEPLTNKNVKLYLPYIPNFFTNATLCAPHFDDSDEVYRYPKDISGIMASAYDWIWNTGFNQDLIDGINTNINCAKDNPIVNHIRQNPSHDTVTSFYRHLSKHTPQDVVSMKWVSPSYTTYYDTSSELKYLYTLPFLQQKFIEENDIEVDEDFEFKHTVGHEEFFDWIGNPYSLDKTYHDIIISVLFDKNNPSEIHANHRHSYQNAIVNIPDQNNFIHTMLAYVNQLPN
jgi:hypothetical protein